MLCFLCLPPSCCGALVLLLLLPTYLPPPHLSAPLPCCPPTPQCGLTLRVFRQLFDRITDEERDGVRYTVKCRWAWERAGGAAQLPAAVGPKSLSQVWRPHGTLLIESLRSFPLLLPLSCLSPTATARSTTKSYQTCWQRQELELRAGWPFGRGTRTAACMWKGSRSTWPSTVRLACCIQGALLHAAACFLQTDAHWMTPLSCRTGRLYQWHTHHPHRPPFCSRCSPSFSRRRDGPGAARLRQPPHCSHAHE